MQRCTTWQIGKRLDAEEYATKREKDGQTDYMPVASVNLQRTRKTTLK